MKTQIVSLDTYDDIVSIRDKLGWKQAGRILLVWPKRGRILTRELDLVLLTRHASQLGAQIALVTKDPIVRENANDLGISVFKSPEDAQKARWDRPTHWRRQPPLNQEHHSDLQTLRSLAHPRPSPWLSKTWLRIFFFIVGCFAVLSIAALLLPQAQIWLEPEILIQSLDLDVEASPEIDQINITGVLPIQSYQIEVEGRETISTTGRASIPGDYATGEVIFTNLTPNQVPIPKGTVIRNLDDIPVRFVTTQAGVLLPGPDTSITIPVKSLTAGNTSNLGPNKLIAIEGPLGLDITVSNPSAIRGGNNQNVMSPSQQDQQKIFDQLTSSLQNTAIAEYSNFQNEEDLLLTSKPKLVSIIEQQFSAEIGEPADQLELTLRLQYEFQTIPALAIANFAQSVLDANLPDNHKPIPNSTKISHVSDFQLTKDGHAHWKIHLERKFQPNPDSQTIARSVTGLQIDQARYNLTNSLNLESEPIIQLTPYWWPRLPYLPFRIVISSQG